MMGKTHMVAGVIVTGALCYYTPLDRLSLICGFIGSTAPDLDLMFGHRKITHSLLGVCIAFGLCSIFNVTFAISFCTNCLVHIAFDSFATWTSSFVHQVIKKSSRLSLCLLSYTCKVFWEIQISQSDFFVTFVYKS